jgi:hypothetical protein
MNCDEALAAALAYAARGWSVLSLCPPNHQGVGRSHRGCCSPGKRPFFPTAAEPASGEWKEYQARRAKPDEIRAWFDRNPRINVGVALGPVSELVGIDVDDEDGDTLLAELAGGDLPPTWEYTTGKGRRLLYRLPSGVVVVNQAFRRPGTEIEILRFMSQGGQVVLPPSVHPNGSVYRWKEGRSPDDGPAADVPAWLRGETKREGGTSTRPADGELITEGGRNSYLTALAGAMRKRGADQYVITAALAATNETRFDPPLPDAEVSSVARSVARYAPDEFTGVSIKFPEPGTGIGPVPEVEPKSAADVAGIQDLKDAGAEVRWLWPGWVQRGVLTAVAAEGGTGKTRLVADLVRRMRHALPWPDGSAPNQKPGPCVALWVVSDNHHDEMVSLCEAFGIADCVKVNASKADPYGGVTLEALEDFALLEKRVKLVRPLVVVVDTVGNSTDKNLSKQEDAKAYYQPLQLIARRAGCAVLCLTHLNAGGKVLGRRALEKVRTCIRMSAERVNDTTCKRRLEVTKSNSRYPAALGVNMGDAGNEYDDQPPAPIEDREGEERVSAATVECMDWLKTQVEHTPRAVAELRTQAEAKGWDSKRLYDAKRRLKLIETTAANRKWWGVPNGKPNPTVILFNKQDASNED